MSVETTVTVWCDSVWTSMARPCSEHVQGASPSDARAEALRRGWSVNLRKPLVQGGLSDLCPTHGRNRRPDPYGDR